MRGKTKGARENEIQARTAHAKNCMRRKVQARDKACAREGDLNKGERVCDRICTGERRKAQEIKEEGKKQKKESRRAR